MTKGFEGITHREEITIMTALEKELIFFKGLLEKDKDCSFLQEKVATIYNIFDMMGYSKEFVDEHLLL